MSNTSTLFEVSKIQNLPSIPPCAPIFIQGITPRSGTNFLYNVLSLHPDCHGITIRDMPEDHLLANANLLKRYASNAASFWSRHGRRGKGDIVRQQLNLEMKGKLLASLGKGLLDYLYNMNPHAESKPLLTKTPNVLNLNDFFHLFPNARLVILVRDGRAVVESNVKSFGAKYEYATQNWTAAAKIIQDFDRDFQSRCHQYMIVRYEDILNDFQAELTKILTFLRLDVQAFNFEDALSLPIFGSSQHFDVSQQLTSKTGYTGWKIVDKKKDFNPVERWQTWSDAQHARFNCIAGAEMKHLGYDLKEIDNNTLYRLINFVADQKWRLISYGLSLMSTLEKTLYAILRNRRDFKNLRMED